MATKITYEKTQKGYANLYATMRVKEEKAGIAQNIAKRLHSNKLKYEEITRATGVPWYVIAIIHELECGGSFSRHLHNGNPLTRRTYDVPAGHPRSGNPPFTFFESAIDALKLQGFDKVRDWSIPHIGWLFECYNGLGYMREDIDINSPYLWSWSTHYIKGKFVADHKFDRNAVSQQCGAMVLLKYLLEMEGIKEMENSVLAYLAPYKNVYPGIVEALDSDLMDLVLDMMQEAAHLPEGHVVTAAILSELSISKRKEVLDIVEAAIKPFLPIKEEIPMMVEQPWQNTIAITQAELARKQHEEYVTRLNQLQGQPIGGLGSAIGIQRPAPVEVKEILSPLDALFPRLKGYKTAIGGALYTATQLAVILQVAPSIFTPTTVGVLTHVAGLIAGIGLLAKIDSVLAFIKK